MQPDSATLDGPVDGPDRRRPTRRAGARRPTPRRRLRRAVDGRPCPSGRRRGRRCQSPSRRRPGVSRAAVSAWPARRPAGGSGPGWPGSTRRGRPPQVSEVLEPLIASHRATHPKADSRLLQRAFDTAARWHSGQYRKSGDPYITHPLAVATILANLGMDTTTLVAALLHDTIEDTDYTLDADARRLRRRGRAAGRRRDQARQGQAGRRGQGRDHPQDGRGDGQGPAGTGDQAGRPAAQHAYADLPAPPQAGAEGQGDAGDPGPAGAPARHEHDQVGARGPGVRHAVPEAVRGDQPADRRAPPQRDGAAAPGDPARSAST